MANLELKRGDEGVYEIPVTDREGNAVVLPGDLKVWFTAKHDLADVDADAEISVGTTNTGRTGITYVQNTGIITVRIPPAMSAAVVPYVLQYDCQIEGTGISRMTVDEGFVYLTDQVTQSS